MGFWTGTLHLCTLYGQVYDLYTFTELEISNKTVTNPDFLSRNSMVLNYTSLYFSQQTKTQSFKLNKSITTPINFTINESALYEPYFV
jgi:hypothetical protein